jgi:hypothetical protein
VRQLDWSVKSSVRHSSTAGRWVQSSAAVCAATNWAVSMTVPRKREMSNVK